MQLNLKALAMAGAILWGGAVLLVGAGGLISPGYGEGFARALASIYPGYEADGGIGDLMVGAFWGVLDGAFAGGIIAWLYNRFAAKA